MRIIAFAIICILPQIGLTAAAAPTFALGAVRQATPAAPQEYVVEVDVAADGYSTFSANIVGDTDAMRLIRKWVAVEREQGVDVVITTTETIETPRIITLIAQYQGRERAGRYWLQPVISAPEDQAAVTAMAENPGKHKEPETILGLAKTEPVNIEPVCPHLVVRKGSLMANVKRLTAHCGHRLGTWYPGDSEKLVDWIVKRDKHTKNSEGVTGLLALLEAQYQLTGVIRSEGKDKYIDFYESGGH